MEHKGYLQSKTIESAILIIIVALLNILGLFEATPGKTYDTMLDMEGRKKEQVKNLLLIGGGGGAIYGRIKAKKKLGKKKGDEDE